MRATSNRTTQTTSSAAPSTEDIPDQPTLGEKNKKEYEIWKKKKEYENWKVRVKTHLLSKDLWQDVQQTDEPFAGRGRENFMALHLMQKSLHPDLLFEIMDIDNARLAWKTLADKYGTQSAATGQGRSDDQEIPRNDITGRSGDQVNATLLTRAIYDETLDTALQLIGSNPDLALVLDENGESPILALASMRHFFPSGNQLGFCKQSIYSSSLCVPSARQSSQENQSNSSGRSATCCYRVSGVLNVLGITQLCEMKRIHNQSRQLSKMCERIQPESSTDQQLEDGLFYTAITRAAKNGIFEFVSKMLKINRNPPFLRTLDRNDRNIFMLAVLHRHKKIFSILHTVPQNDYDILRSGVDVYGNNMLHMAAMIEGYTWVNKLPGAALQMQRELQWFKEVERIVPPRFKASTNKLDGLTPRQLFTKNHENMREKAEQWMKVTAASYIVAAALIVTIMFAVAFTLPGGPKEDTGYPIFLKKKLFEVFMILDALSLFFSSSSMLIFLAILTSSYAEEDFLKTLPRWMTVGLSTLFCSITSMMAAFCVALIIMLHDQYSWIYGLIIPVAAIPVILFLCIHLIPLLMV